MNVKRLNSFSEVLASGALPQLTVLVLGTNKIGDAGLKSFSEGLASGALPQLKTLYLYSNQIGDAGLTLLSEALASGALPALDYVSLSENRGKDGCVKKVLADRKKSLTLGSIQASFPMYTA